MKAWSWQCHKCYGTHTDIIIKTDRPVGNLVCPFCEGTMQVYKLGKGFRPRPAVRSVGAWEAAVEFKYREAA